MNIFRKSAVIMGLITLILIVFFLVENHNHSNYKIINGKPDYLEIEGVYSTASDNQVKDTKYVKVTNQSMDLILSALSNSNSVVPTGTILPGIQRTTETLDFEINIHYINNTIQTLFVNSTDHTILDGKTGQLFYGNSDLIEKIMGALQFTNKQ